MVGYSKGCDLFIQVYKDTDTATDPVITSLPSLPIKTHLFDVPISLEFSVPNAVCTCLCVCIQKQNIFQLVNAQLDEMRETLECRITELDNVVIYVVQDMQKYTDS